MVRRAQAKPPDSDLRKVRDAICDSIACSLNDAFFCIEGNEPDEIKIIYKTRTYKISISEDQIKDDGFSEMFEKIDQLETENSELRNGRHHRHRDD